MTRMRRFLTLALVSVASFIGILWAGGSLTTSVAAVVYSMWWCLTLPPFYRSSHVGETQDFAWATRTGLGVLAAVPLLGTFICSVVYVVIALVTRNAYGAAQEAWKALMLSIPFSTAIAFGYIGYEMQDIAANRQTN